MTVLEAIRQSGVDIPEKVWSYGVVGPEGMDDELEIFFWVKEEQKSLKVKYKIKLQVVSVEKGWGA